MAPSPLLLVAWLSSVPMLRNCSVLQLAVNASWITAACAPLLAWPPARMPAASMLIFMCAASMMSLRCTRARLLTNLVLTLALAWRAVVSSYIRVLKRNCGFGPSFCLRRPQPRWWHRLPLPPCIPMLAPTGGVRCATARKSQVIFLSLYIPPTLV